MKATFSFIISALVAQSLAYPNGAPIEQCEQMTPDANLHGAEPSTDPTPYTIETSVSKYKPGDQVTVTIKGTFKGFMLQARDNTETRVGEFSDFPPETQKRNCDNGGHYITHKDNNDKTGLEFVWTAPNNGPEKITFVATVVQQKTKFWVKVQSDEVLKDDSEDLVISFDACGKTSGCFRYGEKDCTPSTCQKATVYTTDADAVTIQMTGTAEGWIGMGFSKDNTMGEDDVYTCVRKNDVVTVDHYWNPGGHTRSELQTNNEATNVKANYADGRINCQFTKSFTSTNDDTNYDLSQPWYHLHPWGDEIDSDGKILRHKPDHPPTSSKQRTLSNTDDEIIDSGARIHYVSIYTALCLTIVSIVTPSFLSYFSNF